MKALDRFDNIIVLVSGGKDSTACLLWALENLDVSKIKAVFQDSGVENPETDEYIDLISRELIPVYRQPVKGFWEWYREIGRFPDYKWRWCTRRLKTEPLMAYLKPLSNSIVIFGMRRTESLSRSKYNPLEYDPLLKCCRFHPIIDWDEATVFRYIISRGFPISPVYNYSPRCGCWVCPLANYKAILNFAIVHPDIMAEAVKIEAEVGHKWKADMSLGDIEQMAKSQKILPLELENRDHFLYRTLSGSEDNFSFPHITKKLVEQTLKSKHPRGYIEIQNPEFIQLALEGGGEVKEQSGIYKTRKQPSDRVTKVQPEITKPRKLTRAEIRRAVSKAPPKRKRVSAEAIKAKTFHPKVERKGEGNGS